MDEQQRIIHNILSQLDLNESDITIFLLWLKIGAVTIRQLSESSGYGRITTHEIVRRLVKQWLFLETYADKRRLVYPNNIDAIYHLLDGRKLALAKLETEIGNASSIIQSLQNQSQTLPTMRCYKWKEWVWQMMRELIEDQEDIYMMSDGQHFHDLIDNNFLEKSLHIRQKYSLTVQMMFPSWFDYFVFTQGIYQQQLQMRFLPDEGRLTWGMTIWGDKIAYHCYEWRYLTTTILENPAIAKMMKASYQQIWTKFW